jgi:hypothetical protein
VRPRYSWCCFVDFHDVFSFVRFHKSSSFVFLQNWNRPHMAFHFQPWVNILLHFQHEVLLTYHACRWISESNFEKIESNRVDGRACMWSEIQKRAQTSLFEAWHKLDTYRLPQLEDMILENMKRLKIALESTRRLLRSGRSKLKIWENPFGRRKWREKAICCHKSRTQT